MTQARRARLDGGGPWLDPERHPRLQPAYVKLDMEWVRGIDQDPIRRALVSGLAYFAGATGCELIAEGIEEEGERKALIELGVPLGQGYLLGRPKPVEGVSGG